MSKKNATKPAPLTPEQVCARIRDAIIRGELKPGEKLGEVELAERFELSRTPIREAIRQLEVEGLAVRTRYMGASVRQLTPADILALLDIREVLEGLVARMATRSMDRLHLKSLKQHFRRMDVAVKANDVEAYLDSALDFRRELIEVCRSPMISQYVAGIDNLLRLISSRTAQIPGRMPAALEDHARLLDAIERGDPLLAEQLNRKRIEAIRADVERSLSFQMY